MTSRGTPQPRRDGRERDSGRSSTTPTQTPVQVSASTSMKEYADSGYNSSLPSLRSFMPPESSHSHGPPSSARPTTTFPTAMPAGAIPPAFSQSIIFPPIPPILQAQIEAMDPREHDDSDERDSAYDSESLLGDDTITLASYITEYRYENGRRYHAYRDGAYWVRLPPFLL